MTLNEFLKSEQTIENFLLLENPKEYDFTDVNPESEYIMKKGIEKYILYKLSTITSKNDWKDDKGEIIYQTAADKWLELKQNGVLSQIGSDPDSNNELLQMIYKKLWSEEQLKPCTDKKGIKGDTLNSVQHTFNELLRCSNYKKEPSIKFTINIYYTLFKGENLMNVYHTVGNYMPLPVGCNKPRGCSQNIKDYWDLTLKYIYDYYHGDENAIQNIYTNAKIEKKFKDWLDKFGKDNKSGKDKWDTFIEKNYMSPFVENGKPKELWEGHFSGAVLPDTPEKCNKYFENASKWILERGNLMIGALRKKISETEETI